MLFECLTSSWRESVLVTGLALICIVIGLFLGSPTFRRKWFAWSYGRYWLPLIAKKLEPHKARLFKELSHIVSQDPVLKKQHAIRILEIGLGSGTNLPFYAANSRLIGVDVNPNFKKYFQEEEKKIGGVIVEKVICCSAENMTDIPNDSMDAVVGTYVFCSIPDREAALREIKRVLVPGGKYFFLEHVFNDDNLLIATIQNILAPFYIYLMDGCHINRRFLPLVTNAGFSSLENISKFVIDSKWFMVNPTDMGIAVK